MRIVALLKGEDDMLKEKTKYSTIFALIGAVIGILLLLWGSFGLGQKEEKEVSSADEIEAYSAYLEDQAVRLCESVRGVSNVTVALTLEGSFEQVYAADRSADVYGASLQHLQQPGFAARRDLQPRT